MSSEPTIDDLLDLSPAPAPNLTSFPDYLESGELGALLGLSRVRLNTLGKSGVIPCKMVAGINRFPIPAAVHAYVEYAKANPSGRRVADPDLADQKKRLAKEQADKIALANAITRAELVPVEDVRREWRGLALDLRARLLAIGPRVAAAIGLDRTAAASLDAELRAALEDIADDHQ